MVTGALGSLGPIWCRALLEAGARVVALDLPGAIPSAGYRGISAVFGDERLHLVRADVLDRDSLEAALRETTDHFGPPTILVNNAGVDQPPALLAERPTLDAVPLAEQRRIIEVNYLGTFLCSQVFGGAMAAAGRGSIVNVGSLYASVAPDPAFYQHLGTPGAPFLKPPAYGASKAAVVNLTRYLATAWGSRGVRVNALSPGGVRGGQDDTFVARFSARVPLGRLAEPDDLAGPLLFLVSEASSYVTGTELVVDGGFTAW